MTAKETLTSCREAVLELRSLEAQLARCLPTGSPPGVKAQQYDPHPRGNSPTAAAIQLYEGLLLRREELAAQVESVSLRAMNLLMQQVTSPRALVILSDYYRLGLTDQEIARRQELSREHVCAIRRQAFDALC